MADIHSLTDVLIPGIISGIFITSIFHISSTLRYFKDNRYLTSLALTILGLLFSLAEVLNKIYLNHLFLPDKASFYDYLQGIIQILLIIIIPLFLVSYISKGILYNKKQRYMTIGAFSIALILLVLALIFPEWLVDFKNGKPLVPGIYSESQDGPLSLISDIVLIILIIHTIILIPVSQKRSRNRSLLRLPVSLILVSGLFITAAFFRDITGRYPPPFAEIQFSRSAAGLGIFIFSLMWGIYRQFIFQANEANCTRGQLQKSRQDLITMAYGDELTGLPNRLSFLKDLTEILKKKKEDLKGAYVILMDINNFMDLNESYGSDAGDRALRDIASKLKNSEAGNGIFYRTGGDEFALISRKTNEDPEMRASEIQKLLQEGIDVNGQIFPLEASMGIVRIPDDGNNAHILTQNLFSTLRTAKQGRANIYLYDKALHEVSINRFKTVQALRKSIMNKEFRLVYQPIVNAKKEISAVEILLRWEAPDSVNSNPEVFIPIAEAAGLQGPIGKIILELFAENFSLINRIKPDLIYSINISPAQFFGQNLKQQIIEIFTGYSINPARIQLELTESFFMEKFAYTESMINELKKLGIRLALDDFGTGYSSLQYLKYLPIDTLKVDKAFVQGIPGNQQSETLMDVILSAGKAINAKIVVEGIETGEQFIYLKEKKVEMFQGFLFYKPMELNQFLTLLSS